MIQEREKQLIIVVLLVLRARFLWFQTSPSWRGDPSWSAEAFSPDDLTKKNKEKFEMQGASGPQNIYRNTYHPPASGHAARLLQRSTGC